MVYTYVLMSKKDGKWYTGFTHNLQERFKQHNNNKVFSTKSRGPFELIYYEACSNEHDAIMREKYLKTGMGKKYLKNRLKRSLSLTGFTLIELLVVIAIIGVLASIVLLNFASTKDKSKNALIRSDMDQIRKAMEVYYSVNSNYCPNNGTFCTDSNNTGFTSPDVVKLKQHIEANGGTYLEQRIEAQKYCIQYDLTPSYNIARSWCVDSTGFAGSMVNGVDVFCDNLTKDCAPD